MEGSRISQIENDLKHKPHAVLAAARRGSLPELIVLSGLWLTATDVIQPVQAFDVFMLHLRQDQIPSITGGRGAETTFAASSNPANRAYHSLMGVARADGHLEECGSLTPRMLDAWPVIHAWSVYFFKTCVEALDKNDSRRKSTLYVLSTALYTISTHSSLRLVMVNTPQTLEIATHLWMEEEGAKDITETNTPYGTCLMYSILVDAGLDSLKRVHKAAGENPLLVAELAINNTRKALRAPDVDGSYLAVHVELINRISSFEYPFRHALFSKNVIWFVTSALVKFGETLSSTNDNTLVDAMVSCFGYLCNYIESTDGFTWVLQAIRAGLLQAFCDCSTKFDIIPKEDLNIILGLFKVKLPRYLVYRSVLEAIENSMEKVDRDPHQRRISSSIAKQTWYDFRRLAQQRIAITYQVQSEARLVCDNVKCQKFGTKDVMRACAACMNTYYCSKECQASAWKDGDHKTMCKMQQRHRLEGKSAAVSKKDSKFFHALTLQDTINHLPQLRSIAQRDYPSLAYRDLVVMVDYTVHPPTYELAPLTGYAEYRKIRTPSAEARNNALIENVEQNREKYTLFESFVTTGQAKTCVLSLGTGNLWGPYKGAIGGRLVEGEAE